MHGYKNITNICAYVQIIFDIMLQSLVNVDMVFKEFSDYYISVEILPKLIFPVHCYP